AALIMAIDVARFGDDSTVFGWRQGRDFRSRPMQKFHGLATTRIVELAIIEIDKERPDAIVIESTGPGAGVIDQLRDKGYKVIEVHPGSEAHEHTKYFNKRAELWSLGRDWIMKEGCLPEDAELTRELATILYALDRHEQRIKMEPKAEMKKRGLKSPDKADTLMLTFAARVARRDTSLTRRPKSRTAQSEYDVYAY
ncbi:MAG: terminase, partial [Tepidimonas sp.]